LLVRVPTIYVVELPLGFLGIAVAWSQGVSHTGTNFHQGATNGCVTEFG
jgi:hypothetical protein